MVSWFTFLENQPDVDHEKHQTSGEPTMGPPLSLESASNPH
jgi:hypothetical protein